MCVCVCVGARVAARRGRESSCADPSSSVRASTEVAQNMELCGQGSIGIRTHLTRLINDEPQPAAVEQLKPRPGRATGFGVYHVSTVWQSSRPPLRFDHLLFWLLYLSCPLGPLFCETRDVPRGSKRPRHWPAGQKGWLSTRPAAAQFLRLKVPQIARGQSIHYYHASWSRLQLQSICPP